MEDRNVAKPQLLFVPQPDNSYRPFVPILRQKFHAKVPLDPRIVRAQSFFFANPSAYSLVSFSHTAEQYEPKTGPEPLPHPYQTEIESFPYSSEQLSVPETPRLNRAETTLRLIQNSDELTEAAMEIRRENEVAVDLEHHALRSYQGFVCLLQMSTRDKDYVIDAVALRNQIGLEFAEV